MPEIDLKTLEVLDYPPLTENPEEAKAHIDKYGMCLIKDALSQEEVDVIDDRLREQAEAEDKLGLGTKLRGDERRGIKISDEEKVSRLLWNLMNKGDCFLPLIDHPKILPCVQYIIGERVLIGSMGAHMNGPGNERMALHQDQYPLVPHHMPFAFMSNVLIMISDNAPQNGGTKMIPGSHKWPDLEYPQMNSEEGLAIAKSVTAPRGTALVYDARIWHSNGLNRSNDLRNNIAIPYFQPWVRPQENMQYSLRPELVDKLTDRQKKILGFGNYGTLGGHDGSSVSPATFDRDRPSIGILKP